MRQKQDDVRQNTRDNKNAYETPDESECWRPERQLWQLPGQNELWNNCWAQQLGYVTEERASSSTVKMSQNCKPFNKWEVDKNQPCLAIFFCFWMFVYVGSIQLIILWYVC
jgi:hypothetical protein